MKFRNIVAAAAACMAFAGTAQADPINADQWYTFGFDQTGSALFGNCGACTIGVLGIAAPGTPWTINLATAMELVVTDGFQQGDEFELFDFGASIGSTSATANDGGHSCSNNEAGCLADALMSHGTFLLAAGNHSLTGNVTDSPFGSGAAFFIIRAAVPEPGTLALFALALVGLGVGRRARR